VTPALAAERPPGLPGWPRGLSVELAAAYVGLSVSTLRKLEKEGEFPSPTWITSWRCVWLRDSLDAWLDRKDGRIERYTPLPT
jgi:predicted DNA-binding transcriptional regulator AlpA